MVKTILLFGGRSEERLVSFASAQNLASKYNFDAHWFVNPKGEIFEISKDQLTTHKRPFEVPFIPSTACIFKSINDSLPSLKTSTIFMGFHGTEGEDGQIQSLLEKEKIPFTGSDSVSSKKCFDKIKTKTLLKNSSIKLAKDLVLEKRKDVSKQLFDFYADVGPFVVKPVKSGSSFGLHVIKTQGDIAKAALGISESPYDDFMAEQMIIGRELTVGVMTYKNKLLSLPTSEVVTENNFSFDYEGKYLGKGTQEITPAKLDDKDTKQAQKLALEAHEILGCYGYSRTDMILSPTGIYFLETNTLPGLSSASFIPQQLHAMNIMLVHFVEEQLQLANQRYSR